MLNHQSVSSLLATMRLKVEGMAFDAYLATLPFDTYARVMVNGARIVEVARHTSSIEASRMRQRGERIVHRPRPFVAVQFKESA